MLAALGLRCSTQDLFVVACGLLVAACGLLRCVMHAGSSSPTRNGTRAPCIGSTESYPLDHKGSPCDWFCHKTILFIFLKNQLLGFFLGGGALSLNLAHFCYFLPFYLFVFAVLFCLQLLEFSIYLFCVYHSCFLFFNKFIILFYLFYFNFISGCIGSLLLRAGFL